MWRIFASFFFDEYLVVVEKPAGITSVRHVAERRLSRHRRQLQPTLEELVPQALASNRISRPLASERVPPGNRSAGRLRKPAHAPAPQKSLAKWQVFAVHRLDRDTSGLMLFARTRDAERRLANMFRRRTVHREYVAVCQGHVEPQTITSYLVRDRGDGIRGSLPRDADEAAQQQGQLATTHVLSCDRLQTMGDVDLSMIRCKLESGRTHQIRIHLSEAGHAVCGDKIYGPTKPTVTLPIRHALHSDRLSFTHPFTGQHLEFEMALPSDLAQWLRRLTASKDG